MGACPLRARLQHLEDNEHHAASEEHEDVNDDENPESETPEVKVADTEDAVVAGLESPHLAHNEPGKHEETEEALDALEALGLLTCIGITNGLWFG